MHNKLRLRFTHLLLIFFFHNSIDAGENQPKSESEIQFNSNQKIRKINVDYQINAVQSKSGIKTLEKWSYISYVESQN